MLYVDGGQDLKDGGVEAGRAYEDRYRETAYHDVGDEFDETWDKVNNAVNPQQREKLEAELKKEIKKVGNWAQNSIPNFNQTILKPNYQIRYFLDYFRLRA